MRSHYLDRNSGTEIPSNLIFFDTESRSMPCESDPKKRLLSLRCWCGVHVRLVGEHGHSHIIKEGTTAESFWEWLDSCLQVRKKTWMFAHNAAFDLTQLDFWGQLDNGRYTIDPIMSKPNAKTGEQRPTWRGAMCLESSPFFICCRQDRKTINIVDTLNYWRMSLAELGTALGVPKLNMPHESAPDFHWLEYCHRDVEILVRAIVELLLEWRKANCGVFQLTAPMLAMTSFRHMCKLSAPKADKLDIVCQPGAQHHKLEREAYYGGRVTCFRVGTFREPVYHLDVNSLYPFVMRNNKFPRAYSHTLIGVPPNDLIHASEFYGIIAEVLIDSRTETFPLWVGGLQHHSTGHYWTVLSGPELHRALISGCVRRTGRVQYYSIAAYFGEWVDYWYSEKLRGLRELGHRSPVYQLSKIVLNSLSGKFAQRGRRWAERHGRVPLLRWGGYVDGNGTTGELERCRGVAGNLQVLTDTGEPRYSFPAISAFITSYARDYMDWLRERAGDDNVYYQAVDALIVNQAGYASLAEIAAIHPTQLGALKVVSTAGEVEIRGANYYRLDDEITASGMVGVAYKAKKACRSPEIFQGVSSIIASKPDGTVAVSPLPPPAFVPDYRGVVTSGGIWRPFRLTFDPDWTDRPPRCGWRFADSQDTELARTLLAVLDDVPPVLAAAAREQADQPPPLPVASPLQLDLFGS